MYFFGLFLSFEMVSTGRHGRGTSDEHSFPLLANPPHPFLIFITLLSLLFRMASKPIQAMRIFSFFLLPVAARHHPLIVSGTYGVWSAQPFQFGFGNPWLFFLPPFFRVLHDERFFKWAKIFPPSNIWLVHHLLKIRRFFNLPLNPVILRDAAPFLLFLQHFFFP